MKKYIVRYINKQTWWTNIFQTFSSTHSFIFIFFFFPNIFLNSTVDKRFPTTHRYHKIFNKNNLKISYSCMPNMKTIIDQQNRKLLYITSPSESTQPLHTVRKKKTEKTCNCRNKDLCPLNQKCLQERVVYKATVQTNLQPKSYIGSCATTFKTRYNNHKQSFKHINHRNDTALSKFIWKLKEANTDFTFSWSIVSSVYKEFLQRKNLSSMSHGKGFYNQGRPRQRTQHPRRNTKQMPPSQ